MSVLILVFQQSFEEKIIHKGKSLESNFALGESWWCLHTHLTSPCGTFSQHISEYIIKVITYHYCFLKLCFISGQGGDKQPNGAV